MDTFTWPGTKRYLIFGLVELFPSELPLPDETPEASFAYRDQGVTHRVYVQRQRLFADAALSWYGDCRSGKVLLPSDGQQNGSPKVLETAAFSNDPPWPKVVAANNVPFVSRDWGTVRIHHLLQSATLSAISGLLQHDDALCWLSDRLFFDLTEYREWIGSLHLVAPNPVFRELDRRRRVTDDGYETTMVRIVARAGQTLDGLSLNVTEHGPTGIIVDLFIKKAGPLTIIRHLGTVESVSHRVLCPQRGLLDWSGAEPYITSIDLNVNMVESTRNVTAPSLPGRPGETYIVPVLGSTITSRVGAPASVTPMRMVQQAQDARRFRDAKEKRVERWFRDDRETAAAFVRDLIGSARSHVWIVDPYFAAVEFYRFALSVAHPNVQVTILTSAEHLQKEDPAFVGTEAGVALFGEIARLRSHVNVTAFVMTGRPPVVHDRFLRIDDTVWLSGNSLHTLGERAGMMVKLSEPASVIDKLQRLIADERVTNLEAWIRNRKRETKRPRSHHQAIVLVCKSLWRAMPRSWRPHISKLAASAARACSVASEEGTGE